MSLAWFQDTRILLRVPWTARSNQSILKEISPEFSLEGLMLKLKLQHFCQQMWKADSLEKTLMLGEIEGKRRMGGQRMDYMVWQHNTLSGHELGQTPRYNRDTEPGLLQSMGLQRVGHKLETEQQQQRSGIISWYINVTIKLTKYSKINTEWQYTTFLFSHFLHCLHLRCTPWIFGSPFQPEDERSIQKWTN